MQRRPLAIALVSSLAFGAIWFASLFPSSILDPTYVGWMIEGDWFMGLFGWLFARNAPWSVPFAQAPDLLYPSGSSAALTDAIPLATTIAKVFSPFFGLEYQFFGLWMFLGVLGLGVVSVLVWRNRVRDPASLALIAALFTMNPVVATRFGHPPFFAMWMLVGLVGLNGWVVGSLQSARRVAAVTCALAFLACATNPYLAVMCLGVAVAVLARLVVQGHFRPSEGLGWVGALGVTALLSFWLFGFVSGALSGTKDSLATEGFGEFSADPLALFNPLQWSRFVSPWPIGGRQYEGYSYLGLGAIVLLVARVVALRWYRPSARELLAWVPMMVVALGCAGYATSDHVVFRGRLVADLSGLYAHLGPLTGIFRSSGRFMWPLHVLLTTAGVSLALVFREAWKGRLVLLAGVLLQLADLNEPAMSTRPPLKTFTSFQSPTWGLMSDYRHVAIMPMHLQWICAFDQQLVAKLSWEAYRQHLTINSGHVGRQPPGVDCHARPTRFDDDTVYVPYVRENLDDLLRAGFVCGPVEGRAVCVSAARDTRLKRALTPP